MKKDFPAIIGNDELCDHFSSAIRSNSLSHAYILLGPAGSGKHTLAYSLAAALSCEHRGDPDHAIPCGVCDACRKILSHISSDVILIGREDRATLGIESVRFIRSDVTVYPNDLDKKIYIIEDAETMTEQAQNALLLTLEEPPEYVVFLLLCKHTENLLDTIKSRAPILRMNALSREQIVDYLTLNSPDATALMRSSPDVFDQLLKISAGSLGRTLELIGGKSKEKLLKNRRIAGDLISAIADRSVSTSFYSLFSEFSLSREELGDQLLQLEYAIRDLIVTKGAESPSLIFFTDKERAEELSYSFSLKKLIEMLELTDSSRLSIARNANIRLTLTNLLTSLL